MSQHNIVRFVIFMTKSILLLTMTMTMASTIKFASASPEPPTPRLSAFMSNDRKSLETLFSLPPTPSASPKIHIHDQGEEPIGLYVAKLPEWNIRLTFADRSNSEVSPVNFKDSLIETTADFLDDYFRKEVDWSVRGGGNEMYSKLTLNALLAYGGRNLVGPSQRVMKNVNVDFKFGGSVFFSDPKVPSSETLNEILLGASLYQGSEALEGSAYLERIRESPNAVLASAASVRITLKDVQILPHSDTVREGGHDISPQIAYSESSDSSWNLGMLFIAVLGVTLFGTFLLIIFFKRRRQSREHKSPSDEFPATGIAVENLSPTRTNKKDSMTSSPGPRENVFAWWKIR